MLYSLPRMQPQSAHSGMDQVMVSTSKNEEKLIRGKPLDSSDDLSRGSVAALNREV